MHSAYTKIVKEKFGAALQVIFPEFRVSRLQRKSSGGSLYRASAFAGLTLFILLIIHDNADEFNIDIGFSRDGLCPEESFFLNPNNTLGLSSVLFRVSEFRADEKDPWWVIEDYLSVDKLKARFEQTGTAALPPNEYLPRIDALIADALTTLQQYAVPYFHMLSDKTKKNHAVNGTAIERGR